MVVISTFAGLLMFFLYHVSCEPLRIFWNDDTTCSTRVPRVLSTPGWKARNPARSRQHAWHSCRAGCIVISENPQGLATHMVHWILHCNHSTKTIISFKVLPKCWRKARVILRWMEFFGKISVTGECSETRYSLRQNYDYDSFWIQVVMSDSICRAEKVAI